jgi:hypothetical protein
MTVVSISKPHVWRGALLAAAVLTLAAVTGCGGVDKKKLEPLYRSAKAVEASTGVGVTYAQFGALLQQFSTEVAIARDKASNDAERRVVDDYARTLPLYQDSAALWALKIRHGSLLSDLDEVTELANKHGLPRERTGVIDADAGIKAIWAQAAVWMDAGNADYTGAKTARP